MCSHFESDDLFKQASNDFDYSTCSHDNVDTQTHLTIASMLRDKDQYNIVTMAVFFCGVGSFLTFMIATASPDYINTAYPAYPDLLYLLVSIYNTANMLGVMFMVSPAGNYISIDHRLAYGYVFTALFTSFIPSIPYLFDSQRFGAFLFLLFNGVISGLSSALLCTSLFAFAGMLPNTYLVTAVSGQSLAGILAAAIRIINKAAFDTDTKGTIASGVGCFVMAAIIQLFAAIIFLMAFRTEFVNKFMIGYCALRDSKYLDDSFKDSFTPIVKDYNYDYAVASPYCADFVNPATAYNIPNQSGAKEQMTFTKTVSSTMHSTPMQSSDSQDPAVEMSIKTVTDTSTITLSDIITDKLNNLRGLANNSTPNDSMRRPLTVGKKNKNVSFNIHHPTNISVTNKISKCLLSIFIGYCATYLVFPSMIVRLELNNNYLMQTQWHGVVLYSVWSLFGLIGIYIAKITACFTTYDSLWILQFIWMSVMYLFFIAAHEQLIVNDIYLYTIVAVSPLIFGFLSARTFAELPQRITKFEREIAQTVTQLTLVGGICVGGWIAYGMNKLVIGN